MKKRQKLVDLVLAKKKSIAKAAKQLSIKASTAKRIVKLYRTTGTFTIKKKDIRPQLRREHLELEASSETADRKDGRGPEEDSWMKRWSIPVVYSMAQSQCQPYPFYVLTSIRLSA